MKLYKSFWNENGEAYETWFLSRPPARLRTLFQLPRSEIVERLKNEEQYHFHASFGTVLCAVTEQVANFQITCYPVDGRGEAEIEFEDVLTFDRRAGFTLKNLDSDETKQKWLLRHKTLGGPKLLERNNKKTSEEDEEGESDDDDSGPKPMVSPTPSFRSDRRITRLLIARHFADVLQRAFLKDEERTNKQRDNSEP